MIKAIRPSNGGWLEKKLSDQEMDYLWGCIDNKKGDHRNDLAGNISASNKLLDRGDWFYFNTLKPLCEKYKEEFENMGDDIGVSGSHPYYLHSWWVNYQNQTEVNPGHTHGGVYSFVIWMKIPTHYKDQQKLPISSNSTSGVISNFEFSYIDLFGRIRSYEYLMRPELEGTLVFFPAKMVHQVYPFFECDEERISISGNILVNTAKRL